jgi:hypothetical protein
VQSDENRCHQKFSRTGKLQKIKVKVQAEVKKNQVFSTLTLPVCAAFAGQPQGPRKTSLTLT